MVRLTLDYVKKVTCKSLDSKNSEDVVKKLTHLNLPERSIDSIDDLSEVKQLTVLYLQHNNLQIIENLYKNECLTHLYLQHNKITKMENMNEIKNLRKLYLGHNSISVVEGLDAVTSLEELHIECQQLLPGETVYFDPRTITNLSRCLRVFDISSNKICSISDLRDLRSIEKFNASNNSMTDLLEVCAVVCHWPNIQVLDFQNNGIVRQTCYRNKVIASTRCLETLDSKDINDITRSFIHRFEMVKEERKDNQPRDCLERTQFSDEIASIARHLPAGLRQAVSVSVRREALPRAKSLTLSLMNVPTSLPGCVSSDSLAGGAGLQPRPAKKVSHAESVTRSRTRQRVHGSGHLPQLGDTIGRVG